MKEQLSFEKWMQVIGANLRAIRITKKKELTSVAEAINISPDLLEKIENGQYNWEVRLYARICSYYEVSPGDPAIENKFSSR